MSHSTTLPCGNPVRTLRWRLTVSTCASVLLLVPALLLIDNYPETGDLCGWPLSYVAPLNSSSPKYGYAYHIALIDDQVYSGTHLRPEAIVLNVLFGFGLVVAASFAGAYWLRFRGRPFQFSLRWLFMVLTTVGVLLALYQLYGRNASHTGMKEGIPIALVRRILDLTTFGAFVAGAHWIVVQSARWRAMPRLGRLHIVSWVATFLTAVPLVHFSFFVWTGIMPMTFDDRSGRIDLAEFGWPRQYYGIYEGDDIWLINSAVKYRSAPRLFDPVALLTDILFSVVAIAATLFTVERWVRRTRRCESFGSRSAATVELVVLITTVIWLVDSAYRPPWYDYYAWLIAIGCTIHSAVWLFVWALPTAAEEAVQEV